MGSHSFVAAHTHSPQKIWAVLDPFSLLLCVHPQNKMGCCCGKNAYAEEDEGANPNEVVTFEAPAEEPAETTAAKKKSGAAEAPAEEPAKKKSGAVKKKSGAAKKKTRAAKKKR